MKEPNYRDKQLGRNIRDIRLKKGLTLEEFSQEFDSPKPSASIISRWERGVSVPSPKRLKKLSELGGLEINDLYKRGIDFFEKQLENLALTYEEERPNIKHDISQSYNFFNLGTKYLSFAKENSNEKLVEFEELLHLINQVADPKTHSYLNLSKEESYKILKEDIIQQLDKLHTEMSLPAPLAKVKKEYDSMKSDGLF
ncbi:helix-turn-helix transcriptional regulator [Enterococcus sp. BWB1-3]|uniref:helix-turn-helix domain-containing protein n=1 Tax=Enterococcus sp. BWB1-3 TaxID=2787713 RepID=UPI0019235203|nr:helix-turn-helix transcriptional regulator [Enterococcus sp. BWB1-3]MBL1230323.1 helix-turn-helix transcriptional regulator [Enterococcus sp. BWB1-3]